MSQIAAKEKKRKKKIMSIIELYACIFFLIISVMAALLFMSNFWINIHNIDLAFNAVKDPEKVSTVIDYYMVNQTTGQPISAPIVNFYITSMSDMEKIPIALFAIGIIFGICFMFILNKILIEVKRDGRPK